MPRSGIILVGTYTEPIRFGTGEVLPGKGKGIYLVGLDSGGGLTELGLVSGVRNPSFLCPSADGRFVYAVNELKDFGPAPGGALSAFAVRRDGRVPELVPLNMRSTGGGDPCHVAVNRRRTHAYVSNFAGGSVNVFPIREDGSLDEASDFIQYAGQGLRSGRQDSPHAHSLVFSPDEEWAFIPDLGTDQVMIHVPDFVSGRLPSRAAGSFRSEPGDGPRFLEFHPFRPWCYLINELASSVSLLHYDPAGGTLLRRQTSSTLPEGFSGANICADLHLTPDGGLLYASNRGHDSIACFRVDPADGGLTRLWHFSSGGRTPRNFLIDKSGEFLLAANQDSDNLVAFRISHSDGVLSKAGEMALPTPVCVRELDG